MTSFLLAARTTLGFVFVLAALSKLRHPRAFNKDVVAYDIVPEAVAPLIAACIIVLELGVGSCLIAGIEISKALPVSVAILLSFTAVVVLTLRRGRQINCGCFSDRNERVSARTLARLLILLASAAALTLVSFTSRGDISRPVVTKAPVEVLNIFGLALFLLVMGIWSLSARELTAIFAAVSRAADETLRGSE